ncbi:hypothetical protein VTN00DRAFT_10265 [Thermoascus crustaceus]|uniref:uncharacterized protein n=1 Tax=Thermoascus crustaceus TaxID=5088 RepID=UPI0037439675
MSPRDNRGPFFETDYIGRVISLSRTGINSWKLTEKLGEKYSQASNPGDRPGGGTYSEAWTTYACYNVLDNDRKKAILKIRMQIPYRGFEFDAPESRARQAIKKDTSRPTKSELSALEQLTREWCSSAPRMLKYKDRQAR